MRLLSLLIVFFSNTIWANQNFIPLPLLTRNDQTLNLTTKNLKVEANVESLKATYVGELHWERSKQNLLLPKIKLRLKNDRPDERHLYYRYQNTTHLPQTSGPEEFTDLDVSLFDPDRIEVLQDDKKIGEVYIRTMGEADKQKNILMDYSCSGYNLKVYGFEGHFLTVGCELIRETQNGDVIPSLRVYWNSNEYRTLDNSQGPYQITFTQGREARVRVINAAGEKKEVIFKVNFPNRLHRMRLAAGIGPYAYESRSYGAHQDSAILPSVMLYGNYYLNHVHSLKFFEALVIKESVFNHAGLYLGSELAKLYDDRLIISSLIGFQALSYRFDTKEDKLFTQMIFPQGIELAFHHPFGMENYRFVLGGFLSPQPNVIYQNFWMRFGTKVFLEFNFINWEYGQRSAAMYGLSLGFPVAEFF
jgi:hypothetical protein